VWQYGFTHMSCLIFWHAHLDTNFHILLYFFLEGDTFIEKFAALEAVETIFLTLATVMTRSEIVICSEWHAATLTNRSLGRFHTLMVVSGR
jgi:hypothetical protein